MKTITIAVFVGTVAIAALAASYRFGDSAHVISQLGLPGGQGARHPAVLDPAASAYTLIVTSRVAPSYSGAARMVLEGAAGYESEIHLTAPIVPLGWHRHPVQKGNILHDLQPRDAIALWVRLRRLSTSDRPAGFVGHDNIPAACPQCEGAGDEIIPAPPPPAAAGGKDRRKYGLRAESPAGSRPVSTDPAPPGSHQRAQRTGGTALGLAFYDLKTDRLLLRVPIFFKGKEDSGHEH